MKDRVSERGDDCVWDGLVVRLRCLFRFGFFAVFGRDVEGSAKRKLAVNRRVDRGSVTSS